MGTKTRGTSKQLWNRDQGIVLFSLSLRLVNWLLSKKELKSYYFFTLNKTEGKTEVTIDQLMALNKPVTLAEIETTIFQIRPYKAPGPDGILAFFYQEYWDIMKHDIFNTVLAFFHSGSWLKTLNQTFIILIPKTSFPDNVN